MYKVCVIFGGPSVEHEISIISALQAIEHMDNKKYQVIPLYISKDRKFYSEDSFLDIKTFKNSLDMSSYQQVNIIKEDNEIFICKNEKNFLKKTKKDKVDLIFPIVHGTGVEDGSLQGFLETLSIAYVGPSVKSGVVGQDKAFCKDILKSNNVAQVDYKWYFSNEDYEEICLDVSQNISDSVIVKPAELGSSVGIGIAHDKSQLLCAIENAFVYTNKIVIEKFIENFTEVNISVLGDFKQQFLSQTEQVVKQDEILSYEDKYMSSSKSKGMASLSRIIPAEVDDKMKLKINEIALKVFKSLNCSGVIRIDLMIVGNEVFVNEVNNIPGSLSFYLWEKTDMSYQQLNSKLIDLAIDAHFEKEKKTFSIDTNVLNMAGKKMK